jgi:DNA polymerase III subunit gamma/tau
LRIPVQAVDSSAAPAQVSDSSPAAGRNPTLACNGPLGDRWFAVVRQLVDAGAIGAMVRELAMQAQCVAIDEQGSPTVWQLRVERDMLRAPAQVDKLQLALGALLQVPVRIEVGSGVAEDSPARREQAERERAQHEAELLIENDPVVRSLLNEFKGARIVPGSIKPH